LKNISKLKVTDEAKNKSAKKFFMYGMNKSELQLVPHDEAWKDDFSAERERIETTLADSSVLIEHIGSTSIPTVHAKPILDIAILCGANGLESVADALSKLGYEYRGQFDEKSGHFYAVLDSNNIRYCQAHIYTEATNADWHSKLKFRDVLRENTELAREYNEYKLELARNISNKSEYAEIKSKWVDTFILKLSNANRRQKS
jgi:GrpB-like predicted nucleotidyltransferase (UPF0157 family)